VPSTYLGQIGSVASLDRARIALFVDAEHFRRCAARGHEQLTGSRTSPSRVNIDGAGISQFALHPEVFETLYHVRRDPESAGS